MLCIVLYRIVGDDPEKIAVWTFRENPTAWAEVWQWRAQEPNTEGIEQWSPIPEALFLCFTGFSCYDACTNKNRDEAKNISKMEPTHLLGDIGFFQLQLFVRKSLRAKNGQTPNREWTFRIRSVSTKMNGANFGPCCMRQSLIKRNMAEYLEIG